LDGKEWELASADIEKEISNCYIATKAKVIFIYRLKFFLEKFCPGWGSKPGIFCYFFMNFQITLPLSRRGSLGVNVMITILGEFCQNRQVFLSSNFTIPFSA
jgi:hypothetical protein